MEEDISDLKIMLREYCKEKGFYDFKDEENGKRNRKNSKWKICEYWKT